MNYGGKQSAEVNNFNRNLIFTYDLKFNFNFKRNNKKSKKKLLLYEN